MWWNKLLKIISNISTRINHNKDYKATITPMDEANKGRNRCNSGSSNQVY